MQVEKGFEWCLKRGKKGGKHKGLKKIKPNEEESRAHIKKALHNLRNMEYNIKGNFTDWAASAAFYAMYHAILALLYRLGYESRNQECSINAVEYFIKSGKIDLDLNYVEMVRTAQKLEGKNDAKSLREEMQYGAKTQLEKDKLEKLRNDAKEFVQKLREVADGIKV